MTKDLVTSYAIYIGMSTMEVTEIPHLYGSATIKTANLGKCDELEHSFTEVSLLK